MRHIWHDTGQMDSLRILLLFVGLVYLDLHVTTFTLSLILTLRLTQTLHPYHNPNRVRNPDVQI